MPDSKKVTKTPRSESSKESSVVSSSVKTSSPVNTLLGFSSQERMITILTIALIGASFFLGYFYGQLTALKGGGLRLAANNPAAAGGTGEAAAVATMDFSDVADEAGVDVGDFEQCMADGKYATAVADDLALAQTVGANGTPSFFINGKILVGAQPYSAFEAAIEAALNGEDQVLGAGSAQAVDPTAEASPLTDAQWQSLLENPAYEEGNQNAAVTLVEFTDYQCPFCARHFTETHEMIQANYVETGKVRYMVRDLPLPFHAKANDAAQAARCAGEQGLYKEMHHALFENQTAWGV